MSSCDNQLSLDFFEEVCLTEWAIKYIDSGLFNKIIVSFYRDEVRKMKIDNQKGGLNVLLSQHLNDLPSAGNIFRVLADIDHGSVVNCLQVSTGNDVIEKCVNALTHRNPFDLMVITDFNESIDKMRIRSYTAVKAIRCLPAYKKTPIIMVSYEKYLNICRQSGINTWISLAASHDDFVAAIEATLLYTTDNVPLCTSGELWNIIVENPQENVLAK